MYEQRPFQHDEYDYQEGDIVWFSARDCHLVECKQVDPLGDLPWTAELVVCDLLCVDAVNS